MGTATTTSTLAAAMKEYYDRKLLTVARPKMVAEQFADHSKDIPKHEGQTVNFTRYVPLSVITSSTSEGSNPDYVELEAVRFSATLAKYANSVRLTDEIQLMSYCEPLNNAIIELGANMGQSVNRLYRKTMAAYMYPMRVDGDSTYAVSGTITSGATTTAFADTSLTQADHFWVDGTVVFTSGQNKGLSAHVTAFTASTDTVTFTPALQEACGTGDTFRIVASTGIVATDTVTASAVEKAVAFLKSQNAEPYDGQYYIGIISPFVTYDFMQDSSWVNAMLYGSPENLFKGEVGRWGGVRWVEDTDPWTENACDGSAYNDWDRGHGCYASGGIVNHTPIFGKHCYAGIRLEGVEDKVIVKVSGPQDTSNATNAYSMASWRVYFTSVVLNSLFGVSLISGSSSIA